MVYVINNDYLAHHGIKGQKWGIRRYQNEDGSLTENGRKHYGRVLNKLDTQKVNFAYKYDRLARKYDKQIAKANRAEYKGNDIKAEYIKNNAKQKYKSRMIEYEKAVKNIDKATKNIVNEALANNKDVTIKTIRKIPTQVACAAIAATIVSGALGGNLPDTRAFFRANATKYKVKNGTGKMLDNRKRFMTKRLSDTREDRMIRFI